MVTPEKLGAWLANHLLHREAGQRLRSVVEPENAALSVQHEYRIRQDEQQIAAREPGDALAGLRRRIRRSIRHDEESLVWDDAVAALTWTAHALPGDAVIPLSGVPRAGLSTRCAFFNAPLLYISRTPSPSFPSPGHSSDTGPLSEGCASAPMNIRPAAGCGRREGERR